MGSYSAALSRMFGAVAHGTAAMCPGHWRTADCILSAAHCACDRFLRALLI